MVSFWIVTDHSLSVIINAKCILTLNVLRFASIKYQYVETLELKHLTCVAHNGVDHFILCDPYVQRQLDESKVFDVIAYAMMLICHWTRTVCLKPYGIHHLSNH